MSGVSGVSGVSECARACVGECVLRRHLPGRCSRSQPAHSALLCLSLPPLYDPRLLSMTDQLIISPTSTFNYVANGLQARNPFRLNFYWLFTNRPARYWQT